MTSTLQISSEIRQTVVYDKINEAINDLQQLMTAKLYEPALQTYQEIFNLVPLISDRLEREYKLFHLLQYEDIIFQPLTQLPSQQQDQWIEFLLQVQQYALNLPENALATTQYSLLLARIYHLLGRIDLQAIALQTASKTAPQISDPTTRTEQLIPLASLYWQYQQPTPAIQAVNQALAAWEQMPKDSYMLGESLLAIGKLYVQFGEVQRAVALAEKTFAENRLHPVYASLILEEVVGDAIKQEDLLLAQAIAPKIQLAQSQVVSLAEIAVYWATHQQPRLGNRLFTQAWKRAAKEQDGEFLQSLVIQSYSKSGQLSIALNAAQRLTQDQAKAQALGAIAIAYAQVKQYQQVEKILGELKLLIQSPAVISYLGNTLQAAIEAEQYNLAAAILKAVRHNGNIVYQGWLRQAIQTLLQSQRLDEALLLAKQTPHELWTEERNACLQEIAIAYANAQKWQQAIETVKLIQNTISTPYRVLTHAQLAAIATTSQVFTSLIQSAISQTQTLASQPQKALALTAIAQAYLRAGDQETAQSYLQQAIQTVQQLENSENNAYVLMQILDYLRQRQEYNAALTIAQTIPIPELRQANYDGIFLTALSAYAFEEALQVVELEALPDRQATKLLAIAKTYLQLQRREDAIALLDRAFAVAQNIADPESRMIGEFGDYPDDSDRRSQYTRLVKLYFALGRLDKVQQVIEKVQGSYLRDYLQAWIS